MREGYGSMYYWTGETYHGKFADVPNRRSSRTTQRNRSHRAAQGTAETRAREDCVVRPSPPASTCAPS
eukprot:3793080-Pyramimonas_sp.AAC.2